MFNPIQFLFPVLSFMNSYIDAPGAAAAVAVNPPPEPAPAPASTPEPAPAATGAFWETVQDPNLRTFAQTKGWQDAESVVKSAFNAEKLIGAPADEMLRVPKNAGLTEFRQVGQRFGLPESPDKYDLPTGENLPADEGYLSHMKNAFHELGIPASVAKALAEKNNEYQQQNMEKISADYNAKATAEDQDLRREWGNGYERQMALAKTAAKQLGLDGEVIDAIEIAKGYAGTMKFLAELGVKTGEDTFVAGETERSGFHGQMTPAEAKAAWASMQGNQEESKALRDKMHPNHKFVVEKKANLFKIMFPE